MLREAARLIQRYVQLEIVLKEGLQILVIVTAVTALASETSSDGLGAQGETAPGAGAEMVYAGRGVEGRLDDKGALGQTRSVTEGDGDGAHVSDVDL